MNTRAIPLHLECPTAEVEVDVPLTCRRVTGFEYYAGNLDGKFTMSTKHIRDNVLTLLDSLPDDKRAALVAEIAEVQ